MALAEHPLAGDFRLLRQRYGKRPVYRRSPLQPAGPRPSLPPQRGAKRSLGLELRRLFHLALLYRRCSFIYVTPCYTIYTVYCI